MIISIDIGGTKTAFGVVNDTNKQVEVCFQDHIQTQRGLIGLKETVSFAIKTCENWAKKHNAKLKETIFIGSAGNFSKANPNVILPGTAVHLGKIANEFDNCNLANLFQNACLNKYRFFIVNDGIAQLAGGLKLLFQSNDIKQKLCNQKVAYIGPGTGLAGGFAKLSKTGKPRFYTDGHIFDMEIKHINGKLVGAESVYSGTGFYTEFGISTKELSENKNLFKTYLKHIEELGYYLAQITKNIYLGSFKKLSHYPWSKADYEAIKGTTHFILGGSLGVSGEMSSIILNKAQEHLKKDKLNVLFFKVPNPIQSALIAGVQFV